MPLSFRSCIQLPAVLLLLHSSFGAAGVVLADLLTYEMVNIGDVGNAADTNGNGSVNYAYRMGRTEVTIGQWVSFLNAVAASDPYELYSLPMGTDLISAGISRTGVSGSFRYAALNNDGDSSNRPVTYVSWWDAARFANWLSNGQPSGAETVATTENGAYDLANAVPWIAPTRNSINPNTGLAPTYFVPTTDEWYKAAYYSPAKVGIGSPGYWRYATQNDSEPDNRIGGSANQANFRSPTGFATTPTNPIDNPNQHYSTDVGSFYASPSWYGTFDQSGNVGEWTDLNGMPDVYRGVDGGWWDYAAHWPASSRIVLHSGGHFNHIGFRLAGTAIEAVPEIDPACVGHVTGLIFGLAGLLEQRRLRACSRVQHNRKR